MYELTDISKFTEPVYNFKVGTPISDDFDLNTLFFYRWIMLDVYIFVRLESKHEEVQKPYDCDWRTSWLSLKFSPESPLYEFGESLAFTERSYEDAVTASFASKVRDWNYLCPAAKGSKHFELEDDWSRYSLFVCGKYSNLLQLAVSYYQYYPNYHMVYDLHNNLVVDLWLKTLPVMQNLIFYCSGYIEPFKAVEASLIHEEEYKLYYKNAILNSIIYNKAFLDILTIWINHEDTARNWVLPELPAELPSYFKFFQLLSQELAKLDFLTLSRLHDEGINFQPFSAEKAQEQEEFAKKQKIYYESIKARGLFFV